MAAKFEPYMSDQYLAQFVYYYDLNPEHDFDRLWIIDSVADAPIPIGYASEYSRSYAGRPYFISLYTSETQWEHPFDAFYDEFLQIYQSTFSHANMTPQELALSRRPPRMIRDVLAMAAYYGLFPSKWRVFWPVLIGVACDLGQLKWTFDAQKQVWRGNETDYPWHPIDVLLSQLSDEQLACQGPFLFPQLTFVEGKIVPEHCVLAWNFQEMRCYIIASSKACYFPCMRPPYIRKIDRFLQVAEGIEYCDIDNFSQNERIFPVELYPAWEKASYRLYCGLNRIKSRY